MRTICFDTESSHFFHAEDWDYNSRAAFLAARRKEAETMNDEKFYAAATYDFERRKYREFGRSQILELIAALGKADLIVSHSGIYKDFLVFENLLGRGAIAPLNKVRHFDLFDERDKESVEAAGKRLFPKLEAKAMAVRKARWKIGFDEGNLGKARYDVEMTWRIAAREDKFRALRASISQELHVG